MRNLLRVIDGWDVVALLGVSAVLYGLAQWSAPAAWVVGGAVAVAVSVLMSFGVVKRP